MRVFSFLWPAAFMLLFAENSAIGRSDRQKESEAVIGCVKDIDCPGDMLCTNGECASPSAGKMPGSALETKTPLKPEPSPEQEISARTEENPEPVAAGPVEEVSVQTPQGVVGAVSTGEAENVRATEELARSAKGGIVTGLVIDAVGFGLFIVGGTVVSANLGVGLMLAYLGGSVIAIGSTVSTISFTVRHGAYVKAGYDPGGGRRTASWILTGSTLATFGGGFAMGLLSADNFGLAIVSICLNGTSVILEAINLLVRQKWDMALRRSAATSVSSVALTPIAFAAIEPMTGRKTPVFGIAGAF